MRYTGDSGEVVDVPAAVPPPLEPVASPQPPPAPTISAVPVAGGSGGEAHRGLPQAGETREDVGPIVEPHPQPAAAPPPAPLPPSIPSAPDAPRLPPATSEGEAHRGLPQAGETREDVGPIVEPHPQDDGPARPAPPGAASVDTPLPVGGAGTGAGVAANAKPGEAWRELLRFFWHRVPEVTHKLAALRNGLPRVVG